VELLELKRGILVCGDIDQGGRRFIFQTNPQRGSMSVATPTSRGGVMSKRLKCATGNLNRRNIYWRAIDVLKECKGNRELVREDTNQGRRNIYWRAIDVLRERRKPRVGS
jgi:hypothetical protein